MHPDERTQNTMPTGIVSHSGRRRTPVRCSANSNAGGDRKAERLEQQHLQREPADDPEHRRTGSAARARERSPRSASKPPCQIAKADRQRRKRCTGAVGRADPGVAARRRSRPGRAPDDHGAGDKPSSAAMTSAARSGRRLRLRVRPGSLHQADVLQDRRGRLDVLGELRLQRRHRRGRCWPSPWSASDLLPGCRSSPSSRCRR